MKPAPVTVRAQNLNFLILLNICTINFVLMAIPMATTTGRLVPILQIAGINSLECSLAARVLLRFQRIEQPIQGRR